jgi:hypothetical protein
LQKYWRFLLKLLLVFAKIVIRTLVFEKNAKFFAENCPNSQKIVIITLTPDWTIFRPLGDCLLRPLKKIKRVGYF